MGADLLVVAPPERRVEEVTSRELDRHTAAVLARVRDGGRAIITKHGAPVAVLLEVHEAVGLCGTRLLTRRDAERRLFGDRLAAELMARELGRSPRLMGGE